ncbi:hypothetical protein J6590_017029 [Homalodisca vitripennis]|nr:hypothetical protein J6590_017029 [Homalodisca vitripennis]
MLTAVCLSVWSSVCVRMIAQKLIEFQRIERCVRIVEWKRDLIDNSLQSLACSSGLGRGHLVSSF